MTPYFRILKVFAIFGQIHIHKLVHVPIFTDTLVQEQGDATVPDTEDENHCCACGGAKYKMEFQGLWTRQRHPKDFPTEESKKYYDKYCKVGNFHGGVIFDIFVIC